MNLKVVLPILFLASVLVMICVAISQLKEDLACEVHGVAVTSIIGSRWLALSTSFDCGFGIGGGMSLNLEDGYGHSIKIADGGNIAQVQMDSDKKDVLNIRIPVYSDILLTGNSTADIYLNITYVPINDKNLHDRYLKWLDNPKEKESRDWYCKNVFAGIRNLLRDQTNKNLAYLYLGHRERPTDYCVE